MYFRVTDPIVALYALRACTSKALDQGQLAPPEIEVVISGSHTYFSAPRPEVEKWCEEFLVSGHYPFETQFNPPTLSAPSQVGQAAAPIPR